MVSKHAGKTSSMESVGYSPENMDMKDTCLKVLGRDINIPISVAMKEKMTVHKE
jgi:hypothetical protein